MDEGKLKRSTARNNVCHTIAQAVQERYEYVQGKICHLDGSIYRIFITVNMLLSGIVINMLNDL